MVSNCIRTAPPAQRKPVVLEPEVLAEVSDIEKAPIIESVPFNMEALPVGLALEIVSYLHPLELLFLARTNKAFRQLLLSYSSRHIWQAALSQFPVLPGCPEDLNEPQYSRLAFEPVCHYCGERNDSDVLWSLRVRACTECLDGKAEGVFMEISKCDSWCKSIVPWSFGPKYRARYCFVKDLRAAEDAMHRLQCEANGEADLQTLAERWKAEEMKRQSSLGVHLMHCMYWSYQLAREHYEELCAKRRLDIEERLGRLGYADEVAWMNREVASQSSRSFRSHALVRQPTPLTEHAWSNIRDSMAEFVSEVRRELNGAV